MSLALLLYCLSLSEGQPEMTKLLHRIRNDNWDVKEIMMEVQIWIAKNNFYNFTTSFFTIHTAVVPSFADGIEEIR